MAFTNRTVLKQFFKRNEIPTEDQFGQWIDSSLNMAEDHLFKTPGEPLGIEVGQPASGRQNLLNLHRTANTNAVWSFELNPGNNAASGEQFVNGFSIADNSFRSRLFIKENDHGQIGISTILPTAQLHVGNPNVSDAVQPDAHGNVLVDYNALQGNLSLELGERVARNVGSIRLNAFGANEFGLVKAGAKSLELDSTNGVVNMNQDRSIHPGVAGQFKLYGKTGAVGVQLSTDGLQSFIKDGDVGIGTDAPTAKLDVAGIAKAQGIHVETRNAPSGWVGTFMTDAAEPTYVNWSHKGQRSFYLMGDDKVARWQTDKAQNIALLSSKVGIGTASPTNKLHVAGDVRMEQAVIERTVADHGLTLTMNAIGPQATYMDMRYKGTRQFYLQTGQGAIKFQAEQGNKFNFAGSNVGINNETPLTSLHISPGTGGNTYRNWMKHGVFISTGASDGMFIGMKTEAANRYDSVIAWGDDASDKLRFIHSPSTTEGFDGASHDVMTLLADGKVGINNPNPSRHLELRMQDGGWGTFNVGLEDNWGDGKNAVSDVGHKHVTIGGGTHGIMMLSPHVSWHNNRATTRYGRHGGIGAGHYWECGMGANGNFEIGVNASQTTGLFVKSNGNVGVGNNNPGHKLHVNGNVGMHALVVSSGAGNNGWAGSFNSDANGATYVNFDHKGTRYMYLQAGNNGIARLHADGANRIVLSGGPVGIGVSPEAALTISGDGKENQPNGNMHITNDCILFGGANAGKETNSAQISAGKHHQDSLNIIGMGSTSQQRRVDMWAEGGFKVFGKVDTNAGFTVDGHAPITFKRYDIPSGRSHYDTGIPVAHWHGAIVGMRALGGDIYEGHTNPIQVYIRNISGHWQIIADFATHNRDEDWQLDVMWVSAKIARRDGGTW